MKNTAVETREMALVDVQNNPRIQAVFDDKYGDRVRVVGVGDFSQELCGGTHVQFTGDIGSFRIVSESSIASGVRRIEAVTGMEAVDWTAEEHELLIGVSQKLSVKPDELPARIISLNNQLREAEKKIKSMQSQLATSNIDSYIEKLIEINGVPFLSLHIGELPMDNLRQVLDQLRQKISSGVILVASESSGKACFAASISDDFVNKGIHAGQLIGKVAAVADGGGGGKPEKAQAGGKDPSKIEDALREAKKYLESILT